MQFNRPTHNFNKRAGPQKEVQRDYFLSGSYFFVGLYAVITAYSWYIL